MSYRWFLARRTAAARADFATGTHRTSSVVVTLLTSLILPACGPAQPSGPPEIRAGRDECVECGMIISEVKFAAAMEVSVDGHPEVLKFDDIGDMLVYERKNPQLQVRRRWVADLDRRELIPADAAWFVRSATFVTPMASGVVAFGEESRAAQAASAAGTVPVRWGSLVSQTATGTEPPAGGSAAGPAAAPPGS